MSRPLAVVRLDVVLAAIATGLLASTLATAPAWTVDDAFIVARYADNFVSHGELAFNAAAGDRVEGFTSPLAMLFAIFVRACAGDVIEATKVAGAVAALSCPLLVVALGRALAIRPLANGLAACLFAVMPEHAIHAMSGIETEVFVASTLALLVAFARVLRTPRAPVRGFVAVALVTALLRPEGMPAAFVTAMVLLYVRRRHRAGLRTAAGSLLVGLAAPLALVTATRIAYFGAILPNTFYAKRGALNASHARSVLELLDLVFVDVAVIAVALVCIARLAQRARSRMSPRVALIAATSIALVATNAAVYARAEPIMDYGRRFAWHGGGFIVALVLVAAGIVEGRARVLSGSQRIPILAAALAAIVFGRAYVEARPRLERYRALATWHVDSVTKRSLEASRWILEHTPADALIAVYPDAGRVPYLTRRRTIDFGKLNDRTLARATSDTEVAAYFFEREPDVIVFGVGWSGTLFDGGAAAIMSDPRFALRYRLMRVLPDERTPFDDRYEIYGLRR